MAKTFEEDCNTLEKVLSEWDKDKLYDKGAPHEAEIRRMEHHTKYLRVFSHHNVNIIKIEDELQDMRRLRTRYYDGGCTEEELKEHGWLQYLGKSPKTNQQREELLESDPYIKEITKRKRVYETIVKAAEYILKEIATRGYTIKALMEWEMNR